MEQIRYRKTLNVELPVVDVASRPELNAALEFVADAQRHFFEGYDRLSVENLRQALGALANEDIESSIEQAEATDALRVARERERDGEVGYPDRFEIVRKALEFIADLGAHPESGETTPAEARTCFGMVASLIDRYSRDA